MIDLSDNHENLRREGMVLLTMVPTTTENVRLRFRVQMGMVPMRIVERVRR